MIGAHKVLAAYGCLAPRLVTGEFDPTTQRAIWPSTGNYCRGGVADLAAHGLPRRRRPAGGDEPRALRLAGAAGSPTRPTSSGRRAPRATSRRSTTSATSWQRDPANVIFNQFAEFGNYLVHYLATGRALGRVFESLQAASRRCGCARSSRRPGSAGTIGAGDYLKERYGSQIVAVEALECPTMLYNGFGEHNIQGIGDKHIPLIHNVMNTDVAVAISDRATDRLGLLFDTDAGRAHLATRRGVADDVLEQLPSLGLSSICNVLAAIKTAKHYGLGPDDVVVTVATDGAAMYRTERDIAAREVLPGRLRRGRRRPRCSASTCSAPPPTTSSS